MIKTCEKCIFSNIESIEGFPIEICDCEISDSYRQEPQGMCKCYIIYEKYLELMERNVVRLKHDPTNYETMLEKYLAQLKQKSTLLLLVKKAVKEKKIIILEPVTEYLQELLTVINEEDEII